ATNIGADEVALYDVSRSWALEVQAYAGVAGNDITCPVGGPANRNGARRDLYAATGVSKSGCTRHVRADEVALDDVAGEKTPHDDACLKVPGNHVACAGYRAADRDRVRAENVHAGPGVAKRHRPSGIGADEIPLDQIAGTRITAHEDPRPRRYRAGDA